MFKNLAIKLFNNNIKPRDDKNSLKYINIMRKNGLRTKPNFTKVNIFILNNIYVCIKIIRTYKPFISTE